MTPGSTNPEMKLAWEYLAYTGVSVFLTGKAGTGKTTFLHRLRTAMPKRMVVLAPTGVAAINAHGQTIHSFFQLPFGPIVPGKEIKQKKSSYSMSAEKKALIRSLDLLVIDEVSMVRADLLDAIDAEMRKYRDRYKPFGGVQLLLIGDLQQLAPVAKPDEWQLLSQYYDTPYFFSSLALRQTPYITVELRHIYRQQDASFIEILARIRDNRLDADTLRRLNTRYIPDFKPPKGEHWIRLTTHNRMADDYNARMLLSLRGHQYSFKAQVKGKFPEANFPADEILLLKEGAQVMFIKNDPSPEHLFYNGRIGTVVSVSDEAVTVRCPEDEGGSTDIAVPRLTWENTRYSIDADTGEIAEEVEGTFTQLPLRLAWAITIHKSQGLTFDHAVLDVNDSFAHGQTYVALSRCRTLDGLVLARSVEPRSVITDRAVGSFVSAATAASQTAASQLPTLAKAYYLSLLDELFNFRPMANDVGYLQRVLDEHLYHRHGSLCDAVTAAKERVETEIVAVAQRFAHQYHQIADASANPASDAHLAQRINAAAAYFHTKINEIITPLAQATDISVDNKQVARQYATARHTMFESVVLKIALLHTVKDTPFTVQGYLNAKAKATMDIATIDSRPNPTAPKSKPKETPRKDAAKAPGAKNERAHIGARWTPADDRTLLELHGEGVSISDIAARFGRTYGAIRSRLKKLGINR